MNTNSESSRGALAVTPSGVIWKVADHVYGGVSLAGRGLLVPLGRHESVWRQLEQVSHPQFARCQIVGTHAWVQFQPELRASGSVASSAFDLGELLLDLSALSGVRLWGRWLRVSGFAPLLVCVPIALPTHLGWTPLEELPGLYTGPHSSGTSVRPAKDITLELPLLRSHRVRRAGIHILAAAAGLGATAGALLALF